ncbi:hypothetical protein LHK_02047 [Laribacter hongkongensis HLHK9]|uniref:Uncharacterized protein n=2 Tax=Laribacter hongkongensis TaxID=168471 RepID=C1D991_LARHH|nr:hypothetical protein LHK_02047 [Laribacter hongkongensis HLHK9]ASJ24937.1 hypothetical protein LHGZ1_2106 [Laribacter hongkongensis]
MLSNKKTKGFYNEKPDANDMANCPEPFSACRVAKAMAWFSGRFSCFQDCGETGPAWLVQQGRAWIMSRAG